MRPSARIMSWVLLALGVFVTSPSHAARRLRVLAFGDSLTAGYRLPASQAWPAKLGEILKSEGLDVEITNAGVSGDTSAAALRRVEWSLKFGPYDWALVAIGANDGLRQLPTKDMEAHLRQIVAKFRKAGVNVLLIGLRLPTNIDAKYRRDFESAYPRVAKDLKLEFYPFLLEGVVLDDLLNLADRIHPNAKGHEIIARAMAKKISPLLGGKSLQKK